MYDTLCFNFAFAAITFVSINSEFTYLSGALSETLCMSVKNKNSQMQSLFPFLFSSKKKYVFCNVCVCVWLLPNVFVVQGLIFSKKSL